MATFADNFNRADENPLGGDWVAVVGAGVQLLGNTVRSAGGRDVVSALTSLTYDNDQSAEVGIAVIQGFDFVGAAARFDNAGNGYVAYANFGDDRIQVFKVTAGVFSSVLAQATGVVWSVGDSIGIDVTGDTVTAYRNLISGDNVTYVDPSPLAGGSPGIAYLFGDSNLSEADNFISEGFLTATAATFTQNPVVTSATQTAATVQTTVDTNVTYHAVVTAYGAAQPSGATFDASTDTGTLSANEQANIEVTGLTAGQFATIHLRINSAGGDVFSTANVFAPEVGHAVLVLGDAVHEGLTATDSVGDPIALVAGLYLHYDTQSGAVVFDSEGAPIVDQGTSTTTANLIDIEAGDIGTDGTLTFTSAADTTPDAYIITAQTDVVANTPITSNQVTVLGVDVGEDVPVSVTGMQYRVSTDGGTTFGALTSATSNVQLDYVLEFVLQSSATPGEEATGTANIGGVVRQFSVTTLSVPAPSFSSGVVVSDISVNDAVVSFTSDQDATARVVVSSGLGATQPDATTFDAATSISVTASQEVTQAISGVLGGAGYTAWVRLSNANGTVYDSESFTPLSDFAPQTEVDIGATVTFTAQTITGIADGTAVSVVNGEVSINGGAFTSSNTTIDNNQTLVVRLTASPTANTEVVASVTIGTTTIQASATTAEVSQGVSNALLAIKLRTNNYQSFSGNASYVVLSEDKDEVVSSGTVVADATQEYTFIRDELLVVGENYNIIFDTVDNKLAGKLVTAQ